MFRTFRMLVPVLTFLVASVAYGQISRTGTLSCNGVNGTASLTWSGPFGLTGAQTFSCTAGGSNDVQLVLQPTDANAWQLDILAGTTECLPQNSFQPGHPAHVHQRCVASSGNVVFTLKN